MAEETTHPNVKPAIRMTECSDGVRIASETFDMESNMTFYETGRRFEYKVMQALRDKGYTCIRSAGSHGIADVIAWRTETRTLLWIQCASSQNSLRNKKRPDNLPPYGQFLFAVQAKNMIVLLEEADKYNTNTVVMILRG